MSKFLWVPNFAGISLGISSFIPDFSHLPKVFPESSLKLVRFDGMAPGHPWVCQFPPVPSALRRRTEGELDR